MANVAACAADTGSLFGGSPAQPAKGARGRSADPSGAISKAKTKGVGLPKKCPVRARLSQRSQERSRTKARQVWFLRLLRRPLRRLPQPMTQDPRRQASQQPTGQDGSTFCESHENRAKSTQLHANLELNRKLRHKAVRKLPCHDS